MITAAEDNYIDKKEEHGGIWVFVFCLFLWGGGGGGGGGGGARARRKSRISKKVGNRKSQLTLREKVGFVFKQRKCSVTQ